MAKVAYVIKEGRAVDIRFVADDYEKVGAEIILLDQDTLPDVDDLTPKTLTELKTAKLTDLNGKCQELANQLTAGYPDFEKLTWEDQRREAMAWNADNSMPTPYIDVLATEREIDRIDYLRRTVAKTTTFSAVAQKLVGQRQKYEDRIKAIKVEDGEADEEPAKARVAAIKFVFVLE